MMNTMNAHSPDPAEPGESSRIWQPNAIQDLELLHGRYRTFSFTRHFHETAAIGVVESGAMKTYWQGATHPASTGTILLFNPGEVHAPQATGGKGWSFRMFYLDQVLMERLSQRRPLWFTKPFVQNPKLFVKLLRLHKMLECDCISLESESLLLFGLMEIAQYSLSPVKTDASKVSDTKLRRVRDYLQAYCYRNVTLNELAEVAALSPYHLVRSFRGQIGITPHAYLMQARVERGRSFLRAGVSISEVAFQTGFVDQSHFTRQFKKFTGVTPGKYQRRSARS